MKRFHSFLVVAVLMLAIDQSVKAWVRHSLGWGQSIGSPFPGVFEITLTYNQGIAFGLFQGKAFLMTPIAIAIAGGAGWYSWEHGEEGTLTHIAMGLLASGALGNLYDRLFDRHGVTDMFWFRAINFPVFNIADSCITVATFLLIGIWWSEAIRGRGLQPAEHAAIMAPVETPQPDAE